MRISALSLPGALEDDLVTPWAQVAEDPDEAVFEDEDDEDDDWDDLDDPDELEFDDDEWDDEESEDDVAGNEDEGAVGW